MALLEIKNLDKRYGHKPALRNVSLSIEKGKIIGLLGKNGAGKTTLIKIINDLLQPSSGDVLVNGEKIGVNSKRSVAYLPDVTFIDTSCTVKETIKTFKEFFEDLDVNLAYHLLKDLQIDEKMRIKSMSKGTLEKFQLILTISRRAELYIFDEPIGGVDPATRDYILELIVKNYNEDASIIISTHLINEIEKILDEVIFINEGEIILHSDCDELREKENASIDVVFRRMFRC